MEAKYMLSENIKRTRLMKNMTRAHVAEQIGVSIMAIYKWETGQCDPKAEKLAKLAAVFGVTTDELLSEDKKQQPENTPDPETLKNIAVLTRAMGRLSPEDQEKYIAVGKALFEDAFRERRGRKGENH